eukprot:jgi/Psemu1/67168/estExt_Genemark1.C_2860047
MLVQLSPWETSRTSVRLPNASRRRKRDTEDNQEEVSPPSFAASMITMASRRGLSKMKMHSAEFADCLPLLTITSDHHISVLGKKLVETEGSPMYQEFSSLRYNSRPGDAGSFFAKPSNGKYSAADLPRLPAILDTKNDRVYALQQGNSRLTCWNSWKSSGPDEKSALKVQLKKPAVSMALLPMNKGIVYGSCEDGVIYVARIVGDTFSVEYLQVKQPDRSVLIGTFAEIDVEQAKGSGRKRKMSDADGNSSVKFYQVFCDGKLMMIVRNNVTFSTSNSAKLVNVGSLVQNTATVDLLNNESSNDLIQYTMSRAELLVSSSGSAPKVSVIYTVNTTSLNGSQQEVPHDIHCGTFCATISLAAGDISNSPVRLPPQSKQFGLISESVLAAASNEIICLYDLFTGAALQTISLQRILRDMDKDGDWVLHTNVKHGILCAFYPKESHLHVAFSTAALDESKGSFSSNKLKSSSKLACSLLACPKVTSESNVETFNMMSSTGADKDDNGSLTLKRLDEAVTRALTTLEETRKTIISQGEGSASKTSFRDAFDASVSILMKDIASANQGTDSNSTEHNSKDPSNGEVKSPMKKFRNGKLNGGFNSPSSNTNTKSVKIPSYIPQSFIDGAVQISLSAIIRGGKDMNGSNSATYRIGLDARHVLKDLLQSKRVSARLHFEGLYALQETGKKHPLAIALSFMEYPAVENPLSALQIILELIVNCSDLSERQLVIMLDYMMRHAKADDIVKIVQDQHTYSVPKDHKFTTGDEKKTILAGVKVVLEMIVSYSECNEAMLRAALVEELSSSAEAVILARLLPGLLISNPDRNPTPYFVRSACLWIASLSESFTDDLSWARTSSGESYLAFLLNSVTETAKNSQEIMSLKDSIGLVEQVLGEYYDNYLTPNCNNPLLGEEDKKRRDHRTPRIAIKRYNQSAFMYLFRSGNDQALLNCCGVDDVLKEYKKQNYVQHREFDATECLALILFWSHTRGSAARAVAIAFGLTASPMYRWLKFVCLPNEQEIQQYIDAIAAKYPTLCPHRVWAACDGLKLHLQQSGNWTKQNQYYNGWMSGTYVNSVFLFCPDGRIQACVLICPGSWHDSTQAEYGLYEKMERMYELYKAKSVVDLTFRLSTNDCLLRSSQYDPVTAPIEIPEGTPTEEARAMKRRAVHKAIAVNRDATSVRQMSEWGMRQIQGGFPRLKDNMLVEEMGDRRIILKLVVLLYNF